MRGSPHSEYAFPGVSPRDGDVFREGGTGRGRVTCEGGVGVGPR